jgi:phospholipid/cholesterol/gamma-HCH transport system substrate-binding protein
MVKIKINDDLQIPALTLAVIKSDLLGVNSIELRYRKSDSYAKNGDTLSTIVATTIQEEVSMQMMPIKVKAEGMMSSLDSILSAIKYVFNKDSQKNLSDAIERIKSTIINLEKSSKGLDVLMTEQSGRLDRILSNVENITANLKNNSGQIDNIIGNFSQLSDSLAQINIQNTFSKLDNSLVEFEQIVSKINRGEGTVGQLVHNDSLYVELEAASKELHLLLEDVRLNPKRYVRVSVFGGKNNDSYVAPNKQPE